MDSAQLAKEQIIDAAGPVFAEKGFRDTTVREICRRANKNLAAVNYHFGDKQQMYVEVLRRAHESKLRVLPLPDWTPDTLAEDKLRDFIRITLLRMVGHQDQPWHSQLLIREVFQPTGAVRDLVRDYFRPHLETLLSILNEMLPAETPEHRRFQTAFSILGQCLFYRVNPGLTDMLLGEGTAVELYQPERLAAHIADFSIAALQHNGDSTQKAAIEWPLPTSLP